MVGLPPDESWRAGDRASSRVRRTQPHNGITYDSLLQESASSGEHLAALLSRLAPYAEQIGAATADQSILAATVWVVEHTENDMTDIGLDPAEMSAIAAMGASLVASSYFLPEHDGESLIRD